MNEKARELNLQNTHFVTPHGLDEEEHYTTAYELAKIADYALKIEEFAKIVKTKEYTVNINGNSKNLRNTNELLGALNGVYGVKTGFTNGANRCLVTSVKRGDLDIISVVLGADTKKDRTKDSIKIIEYAFSNYQMVDMGYMLHEEFDKLVENTKFNIVKGVNSNVQLKLSENNIEMYPVHKNAVKDVQITSEIKQIHEAPLNENTKLRRNNNKNRRSTNLPSRNSLRKNNKQKKHLGLHKNHLRQGDGAFRQGDGAFVLSLIRILNFTKNHLLYPRQVVLMLEKKFKIYL